MAQVAQNEKKKKKSKPFMIKLFLPLLTLILVFAIVFTGTIIFGGTSTQLRRNAYELFSERVENRAHFFNNDIAHQLLDINGLVLRFNSEIKFLMDKKNVSPYDLKPGSEFAGEIMEEVAPSMLSLLKNHPLDGIFVVFTGSEELPNAPTEMAGFFMRAEGDGFVFDRSPKNLRVVDDEVIIHSNKWTENFNININDISNDFLSVPFTEAKENPAANLNQLAYWNGNSKIKNNLPQFISYTLPLILENGKPYGVVGVSISTEFLGHALPYSDLRNDDNASFVLGLRQPNGSILRMASTGPLFENLPEQVNELALGKEVHSKNFLLETDYSQNILACVEDLSLQSLKSQEWVLVGLIPESFLFRFSKELASSFFISLLFAIIAGALGVLLISRVFTRPISRLAKSVSDANPNAPILLKRTDIIEMDALASAIEDMSRDIVNSASKLSALMGMTSVSTAAFEYAIDGNIVSYTREFFRVLGKETPKDLQDGDTGTMSRAEFDELLQTLEEFIEELDEEKHTSLYAICEKDKNTIVSYIRLRSLTFGKQVLGVAEDVTVEIVEHKRTMFERDYDPLTKLCNRHAFHEEMGKLLEQQDQLKIGVLIMLNLDNLKYINDTYGHDVGDGYISSVADAIRQYIPINSVSSRMSGDEFHVFMYGFVNKEEARATVAHLRDGLRASVFQLPNETLYRLRASGGVVWYPDDAHTLPTMLRYADFTMYQVKNSKKGEFMDFDLSAYSRGAYLVHGKEELNKLIDSRMLNYMFQPIICARTGEVFAYEALMRSHLDSLKSPAEILGLARTQSKLHLIEKLTWFKALESFKEQTEIPESCKVFINSIASQCMSDAEMMEFEEMYTAYLPRLVVEMLEEEKQENAATTRKLKYISKWNAKMALDDYGTGYNGEVVLLSLSPDYIKIDMSLVRNINVDYDRQKLLCNMISYAGERNIKVIAEGVETSEEMKTLIVMGVDFLQGYYLARPAYVAPQLTAVRKNEILAYNGSDTAPSL